MNKKRYINYGNRGKYASKDTPRTCAKCGIVIPPDEIILVNKGPTKGGYRPDSYCRECRNRKRVERRLRSRSRQGLPTSRQDQDLMPLSEIAKEMGLSSSYVKQLHESGMRKLKALMEEDTELAESFRELLTPEPSPHNSLPIFFESWFVRVPFSKWNLIPVPYPPRYQWRDLHKK